MNTPKRLFDSRAAQAQRVADYLERHPASTQKEIDAACDAGSVSKVLSDMPRHEFPGMGYGLSLGWRTVPTRARPLRTYTLLHRPRPQAQIDLFKAP